MDFLEQYIKDTMILLSCTKFCLINTKMGNSPFFGKSFSISNLKKSVENSLSRLKCDNINVLFLHNPREE